jgi:hypothetical protein
MEEIRDEKGTSTPGHSGQKPVGEKSELRKKVLAFVEERWEELRKWFDLVEHDLKRLLSHLKLLYFR